MGTYLHCANHPCSVTAPLSSATVLSGNLYFVVQGLPGEVLKSSSSSEGLSAPSWSLSKVSKSSVKK